VHVAYHHSTDCSVYPHLPYVVNGYRWAAQTHVVCTVIDPKGITLSVRTCLQYHSVRYNGHALVGVWHSARCRRTRYKNSAIEDVEHVSSIDCTGENALTRRGDWRTKSNATLNNPYNTDSPKIQTVGPKYSGTVFHDCHPT